MSSNIYNSDSIFFKAVIFSLFLHLLIVLRVPLIKSKLEIPPAKKFQVTYLKLKEEEAFLKDALKTIKENRERKELALERNSDITKNIKPLVLEKKIALESKTNLVKPINLISEPSVVPKKIVIPDIENKQKSLPGYKSYYQTIRGKIKETAYRNYNIKEKGDVYLTFLLERNGALMDLNIDDSKSSASESLKKISQASLKEASPFPNFPSELNSERLSFNVIISFETE